MTSGGSDFTTTSTAVTRWAHIVPEEKKFLRPVEEWYADSFEGWINQNPL
jgi:hypothetical protein